MTKSKAAKVSFLFVNFLIIISLFEFNNAWASQNTNILPIAKGGTNANTASGAATNILGTNFANYSGILPIAKGGTDATAAKNALLNLNQENPNNYLQLVYMRQNKNGVKKIAEYKLNEIDANDPSQRSLLIEITGPSYARYDAPDMLIYFDITYLPDKSLNHPIPEIYSTAQVNFNAINFYYSYDDQTTNFILYFSTDQYNSRENVVYYLLPGPYNSTTNPPQAEFIENTSGLGLTKLAIRYIKTTT
ncbi:MAG: hypothetical protein LBT91_01690 [Bifidobacteriaceae bacterium]|jgi:hypothetical protein|nr:hypothetical protein [Bifidobacteriaceae bacterium]